jgi:hypothetical protein
MSDETPKKLIDYIVPILLAAITLLLASFNSKVSDLSNAVTELKVSIGSISTELKNQRDEQNRLRTDFDLYTRAEKTYKAKN